MKTLLVTGSSGLIGSEVCVHFAERGWQLVGLDNNQRAVFFGPQGDTRWNQRRLQEQLGQGYRHIDLDIRDRQGVLTMMAELKPDAIVHTAAQPSHDRAAAIPFDDFDTNAVGTLNLIPCCCLQGGCLTGPNHSGVELHGFLSYLVKCNLEGRLYEGGSGKPEPSARKYLSNRRLGLR